MHDPAPIVVGALLLGSGLLLSLFPYRVALYAERLDAVGSTTSPGEVEPAGWSVSLNRIGGVVTVVIGWLVLLLGVLE